jgi:signal transduction histidine kinase
MTETNAARPRADPPIVSPPPRFVERRTNYRREADRESQRETTLLARSLDVLAVEGPAEARLAGLLELLAETAGARRTAVLAEGADRRVAVSRSADEGDGPAEALAAWLDAWAPRPRSHRAASGSASVAIVVAARPDESRNRRARRHGALEGANDPHFACLPIPTAGGVALGFDFEDERGIEQLDANLPPKLARHAAVALALVTEQVAMERELEALRAQDTERNRFVSTVAHELRTPLTGLSGYLELILNGQVADEADELDFLERSLQITSTMSELVGDLLELSRLESGSLRLEIAPFSVAEIGNRVVGGLAPLAMSRGVELRTTLPPRIRTATGDRRRVEQILTNLVGNALKFAPSGSMIELSAWFDGSVSIVAVRDEGSGIAPDDRSRIFERFHRLAAHERITGTGLGLPIARELARRMGGDLEVASVPASGSSFVLVLPGPAGAQEEEIGRALEQAVVAEEIRLEERAVLRANAGPTAAIETVLRNGDEQASRGNRPPTPARPTLVIRSDEGGFDRQPESQGSDRRPILRTIDGARTTDPRPA